VARWGQAPQLQAARAKRLDPWVDGLSSNVRCQADAPSPPASPASLTPNEHAYSHLHSQNNSFLPLSTLHHRAITFPPPPSALLLSRLRPPRRAPLPPRVANTAALSSHSQGPLLLLLAPVQTHHYTTHYSPNPHPHLLPLHQHRYRSHITCARAHFSRSLHSLLTHRADG
jgi:hypothetical protein